MCGLVGIAGNLEFCDEGTMKRLLVFDVLRGGDSTGLGVLSKNGSSSVLKVAGHTLDFFDHKDFVSTLNGSTSSVFLGHNRAATRGKVNKLNAHPFEVGDIVGAHNGTLDLISWRRLEEALGEKFDVDSEAIINGFAKLGVEETISLLEEGSSSSEGAWALTWFDKSDGTINMLRNKHRPLYYAYTKDFGKLIWASEWPMIAAAVEMSSYEYELHRFDIDGKQYRFLELPTNQWYKWSLEELRTCVTQPKPEVTIVKGREPKVVVTAGSVAPFNHTRSVPWHQGQSTRTPQTGNRGTTTYNGSGNSGNTGGGTKDNVVKFFPHSQPLGDVISDEYFERVSKFGCSYCGAHIDKEDEGYTIYMDKEVILCSDCSENPGNVTRVYLEEETDLKWVANQ